MNGQVLDFLPSPVVPFASFAQAQRTLAHFNHVRLEPGEAATMSSFDPQAMALLEASFLRTLRLSVAPLLASCPDEPVAFLDWFEELKQSGPGQHDPLFPWLANSASFGEVRWFIEQEVAGEAGFEDLLSMTQVKMPVRPKLEMARNYWDEMGRGRERGMHGPLLGRLAQRFNVHADIDSVVPEALAVGNLMVALAFNRRYAFQSVGALGVIELTAPSRALHVAAALDRVGIDKADSNYFALHAAIDVKHSRTWNAEVIEPLVREAPERILPIAEGALLRLTCGARSFERYRAELGL